MSDPSEHETIAADVAEHEFMRFVEAMDLDVDPTGWDDEDKRSFEEAKRKLVSALRSGKLVIDEHGQPVFTPSQPPTDPITFYEPTGATLMAMDQKKKNHDVAKMYAAMADMTRQPMTRFSKMVNRDVKICTAIASLFFGG